MLLLADNKVGFRLEWTSDLKASNALGVTAPDYSMNGAAERWVGQLGTMRLMDSTGWGDLVAGLEIKLLIPYAFDYSLWG